MKKFFKILRIIVSILILPVSIFFFFKIYLKHKKISKLLKNTINTDAEFALALLNMDFAVDWIGRLYAYLAINDESLDEDDAYDQMMRTLAMFEPKLQLSGLFDVLSLTTKKIQPKVFRFVLAPYTMNDLLYSVGFLILSTILTIIAIIIFYTHQL